MCLFELPRDGCWPPVLHAEQRQQQQYVMFGSSSTAVTDKDVLCYMRQIV
jgi:hypothetical protein